MPKSIEEVAYNAVAIVWNTHEKVAKVTVVVCSLIVGLFNQQTSRNAWFFSETLQGSQMISNLKLSIKIWDNNLYQDYPVKYFDINCFDFANNLFWW